MKITGKKLTTFKVCALAVSCVMTPTWAYAKQTLRVLTWPGYADTEVVAAFERRFAAEVELTYVTSDDDLWHKITSENYDVFAVNTAELQRYIEKGLSKPISLENIPNHKQQLPRFQNLQTIPGLVHQDNTYAIPYTYSEMGLIYNRKLVKQIPHSMAAMWNPDFRGQVLAFNASNHNFSLVGLLMGVKNPFRMNDAQLQQAAKKLVNLRRNVLTFYATAEEAAALFSRYDIALMFGNYGRQQIKALQDAGADIGYVIPDEGALAWLDCWAIARSSQNPALAEQWINYTLEPSVSERLSSQHGLANTISATADTQQDNLIWLEPLQDPLKQKQFWDRIISGETLETF